jgi:hypothetical protein
MLYLVTGFQNNNINLCEDSSPPNTCTLKSSAFVDSDIIFDFPQELIPPATFYEINGNGVNINCSGKCNRLSILNKSYRVQINLNNVNITAGVVEFQFQGSLETKQTVIDVSGMSSVFTNQEAPCLSNSGFCYYDKDKIFTSVPVVQSCINRFYSFTENNDINILSDCIGTGIKNNLAGGGRIIMGIDEITINQATIFKANSYLTKSPSSGILDDSVSLTHGSDFGDKYCPKSPVIKISGMAGYTFFNIKIWKLLSNDFRIEALGSDLKCSDTTITTSSSSGQVFIQLEQIIYSSIKDKAHLHSEDSDYLFLFIQTGPIYFTSSAGFTLIKSPDKFTLNFEYLNKQAQSERGIDINDNQNMSNVHFDLSTFYQLPFYLTIQYTNIEISFTLPSTDYLASLFCKESSFRFFLNRNDNYLQIKYLTLTNSVFKYSTNLLIIDEEFKIHESELEYKKLFIIVESPQISRSKMYIYNSNTEAAGVLRQDYSVFKSKETILANLTEYQNDYFITFDVDDLILDDNSQISAPVLSVYAKKSISVGFNCALKAQFLIKVTEIPSQEYCGVYGAYNDGMGFVSLQLNNDICFYNFLKDNKSLLYKLSNEKLNPSSSPAYYKRNQIKGNDVFKFGGGIAIIESPSLLIKGTIAAIGEQASIDDRMSIGASAGGTISIKGNLILMEEEGRISVTGGECAEKNGIGGGGKIILSSVNFLISKLRLSNFELSLPLPFSDNKKMYPNIELAFYDNFNNLMSGKILNTVECDPGYTGPLCQLCPINSFKPHYGFNSCIDCPCEIVSTIDPKIPMTSIKQCMCEKKSIIRTYFLEISLIFGILMSAIFFNQHKKTVAQAIDDSFLHLKIENIPNVAHVIHIRGENHPLLPLLLSESSVSFIGRAREFCKSFNDAASWNMLDKIILLFFFFACYSPLYISIINILKLRKVQRIKVLMKSWKFQYKGNPLIIKCIVSSNYNSFQLAFLDMQNELKFHNFLTKFPFNLELTGNGNFNSEFKINFADPFVLVAIKEIKRSIEYSGKINILIPNSLKSTDNHLLEKSINLRVDYNFAYLNLLFATILLDVPKLKLRERFVRIDRFTDSMNKDLNAFGYKIKIMVNFTHQEARHKLNLSYILSAQSSSFRLFVQLLTNRSLFDTHFVLVIDRIERKEPISIFFGESKRPNVGPKIEKPNHKNDLSKKVRKVEILNSLDFRVKEANVFQAAENFAQKMVQRLMQRFWKLLTYHNCEVYASQLTYTIYLLFIALVVNQEYIAKYQAFNDGFSNLKFFFFPAIEQITILIWLIQVIFSKKKLMRMAVLCSFMTFIKATVIGVILFATNFNQDHIIAYLYWIEAFICFTICYTGTFIISYQHFMKYLRRMAKTN